jgi:hypothetical protein
MKPETSERLFVESLVGSSVDSKKIRKMDQVLIDKLTGDASTRRYYRIESSTDAYVVCLDNPNEKVDKSTFIEIQEVFRQNHVRVPAIFDYDMRRGYILEEDLGDITLLGALSVDGDIQKELTHYTKVLEQLISIHQIPVKDFPDASFNKLSFDYEKLKWEINFCRGHFLEGLLGIKLTTSEIKVFDQCWDKICHQLAALPQILCHRDYHSRNIMLKGSDYIVIDFQDARLGPVQYDLVSLLDDCYYQLDSKNREILLWRYFERINDGVVSKEKFETDYHLMLLQRTLKAIGSFSYIYRERGDIRYLKYIGFAFEKMRKSFVRFPEFSELINLLSTKYYAS